MANNVKSGDYVVLEFGHNYGVSLTPTDNGRTDCNPVDNNYATTCQTTYKYSLVSATLEVLVSEANLPTAAYKKQSSHKKHISSMQPSSLNQRAQAS